MEHPFINQTDLKSLTVEQLQEKISKLMDNIAFAYRTGNGPMISQLQMMINSYKTHHQMRMDELFEKQNIKNKINIESDKK